MLVGAALAVGAAGCGSSGGGTSTAADEGSGGFSTYESQMQALGQSLGATLMDTGTANRTATDAQVVKNLRKAQRALRSAASQLGQITPPPKARAGHELLEKGVREYADEIDDVIAKFKRGQREAAFSVTSLKGVKDMTKGTHDISAAGYIIVLGG